MTPDWITLTVFEDPTIYTTLNGYAIDVRPSHMLCITELKQDASRANNQASGKSPQTCITLNEAWDTLEDANESIVVHGNRKIWVYETISEIRVLLGRKQ